MAFVLARLQQQVWKQRYETAVRNGEIEGVSPEDLEGEAATPEAKDKKAKPAEAQSAKKGRGRPRQDKSQASGRPAAAAPSKGEKKSKRKSSTPPTLDTFFSRARQTPEAEAAPAVPEKKQKTLAAFMKGGAVSK
eukprot:symbB.v1.2.011001.t1/scaffold687.1/size172701/7